MKKQLRLVLLAVLIVVMMMTMLLMASATGTPAPAATDNYQVVDAGGVHVGYYVTLTDALANVTANNYKVVVLKDVTEATGVALSKAFTYTITGGTQGKTITFADTVVSSRSGSAATFLDLTAGAVTLENLTLAAADTVTTAQTEYITLNGSTALTLNSVKVNGSASTAFCYSNKKANIVVAGETNLNMGDTARIFYLYMSGAKNSAISITGGKILTSGNLVEARYTNTLSIENATVECARLVNLNNRNAKDSVITLKSGAVIKASEEVFYSDQTPNPVTVTIDAGAKVEGKVIFNFKQTSSVNATLNGGELHVVGAGALLANQAAIFKSFTLGQAVSAETLKIYFDDGASTPDTALDQYFDWNKISVVLSEFDGYYEITQAGTYDISSFDSDFYKQIKKEIEDQSTGGGRFPHVVVNISGWIPIIVNHAEAVLNVSGSYTLGGISFIQVVAGKVNVNANCVSVTMQPIFELQGGTLNITGGTYTADVLLSLTGNATIGISGGTFVCQEAFEITTSSSLTISGGSFTNTDKTQPLFLLNHASATLTIIDGTFVETGIMLQKGSVTIAGGEWSFSGDRPFNLYGGATMAIKGGTFDMTAKGSEDFIYISNGNGATLTFGDASDKTMCPVIHVTKGSNIFEVAAVKTNIVIYNGRFVKNAIDRELDDKDKDPEGATNKVKEKTSPLFVYDDSRKTASREASTLIIHDGYFEATRVLMDYYGMVKIMIFGGTFKSNLVSDNIAKDAAHLITIYEDTDSVSLTIYGGNFDGGCGYTIVYCTGSLKEFPVSFYGGYFTGGYHWYMSNCVSTLTIGSRKQGEEEISPVFEAKDSFTYRGFYFYLNQHVKVNVTAGTFKMKDVAGRDMWYFAGPVDMRVSGGTFTVTINNAVPDSSRTVGTHIFRTGSKYYLTNLDIYGGTFVAAHIVYYKEGGGVLNIYNGDFRSNFRAASCNTSAMMIHIANAKAIFNIYGGRFTGNEYTYCVFAMNEATGGTMQLNIFGGTVTGGCYWIYAHTPGAIRIDKNPLEADSAYTGFKPTNPTFKDLSRKAGYDVAGFYMNSGFEGGTLDIKAMKATFDSTTDAVALFLLKAVDIVFNPEKDSDIQLDITSGAVLSSSALPCCMFSISTEFKGSIVIKGGSYISRNTVNMFNLTTTIAGVSVTEDHNVLTIEGGSFKGFDKSIIFYVSCEIPQYVFRITDGTFETESASIFFLTGNATTATGMNATFVVDGGTFISKATRMIYLDHNTAPLVINNGTFLFEDRDGGNKADDAIVYAVSKQPACILIKGGTFVDKRTDSDQSILKMSKFANIRLEGDFKLYTLEEKPYFLKDTVIPTNSLPLLASSLSTYEGQSYYLCFGYYTEYAPVMVGSPVIRPVLGAEGITFTSSISADSAAYLATLGTVSYGTLIFPSESFADGWQFGTDFLKVLTENAAKYVIVEAKDGIVTEADGSLTIRASLINIKASNYTRSFTGIAFAKVTDAEGNETYYWATHASAGVSNTMRNVAEVALNDVNSVPTEKNGCVYCYVSIMKNKTYSRYNYLFQEALRKYVPGAKPKS